MGLKALRIAKEECERTRGDLREVGAVHTNAIDALERRLVNRIGRECVELEDPKCTWNRCGAEAVDDFFVREVGEMRDSKESLCADHISELEAAPLVEVRGII
jgi:hypothetical protein